MRKTLSVAALVLSFCCPTIAGEIPTPPAPQPQAMTVEVPTLNSEIQSPGESESYSESLTEITLGLLAVLPSLL
ncbi:MAG TPA: hypothetical protein VF543_11890 [Pyrinomonadaceae bacterium]|jgi:hypothetical protein